MAIIARPPATIAKKAVTIRMPEPVAETLHEYASFIGSSLDHVVVEALKLIFKKDAEFKAWQDGHRDSIPGAAGERASAESAPPLPPLPFSERKRDRENFSDRAVWPSRHSGREERTMSRHAETTTSLCKSARQLQQQQSCWQSKPRLNRQHASRPQAKARFSA